MLEVTRQSRVLTAGSNPVCPTLRGVWPQAKMLSLPFLSHWGAMPTEDFRMCFEFLKVRGHCYHTPCYHKFFSLPSLPPRGRAHGSPPLGVPSTGPTRLVRSWPRLACPPSPPLLHSWETRAGFLSRAQAVDRLLSPQAPSVTQTIPEHKSHL